MESNFVGKELDGVEGLEPSNDRIKIYCLTNLAIPQHKNLRIEKLMNFVLQGNENKVKKKPTIVTVQKQLTIWAVK